MWEILRRIRPGGLICSGWFVAQYNGEQAKRVEPIKFEGQVFEDTLKINSGFLMVALANKPLKQEVSMVVPAKYI